MPLMTEMDSRLSQHQHMSLLFTHACLHNKALQYFWKPLMLYMRDEGTTKLSCSKKVVIVTTAISRNPLQNVIYSGAPVRQQAGLYYLHLFVFLSSRNHSGFQRKKYNPMLVIAILVYGRSGEFMPLQSSATQAASPWRLAAAPSQWPFLCAKQCS